MKLLLQNPSLNINIKDPKTDVNAFWLAAFYGKGHCLRLLAEAGAYVYCKHRHTLSNALHISIANKHYSTSLQLVKSNFPSNDKNFEGVTPLLMITDDVTFQGQKLAREILKH